MKAQVVLFVLAHINNRAQADACRVRYFAVRLAVLVTVVFCTCSSKGLHGWSVKTVRAAVGSRSVNLTFNDMQSTSDALRRL